MPNDGIGPIDEFVFVFVAVEDRIDPFYQVLWDHADEFFVTLFVVHHFADKNFAGLEMFFRHHNILAHNEFHEPLKWGILCRIAELLHLGECLS
ncbi:hypothetical protein SDC9_155017 [bioreactor metagenome]|uniref:Uncharacterized protein n=1 Tax=bioreactor metagenome TaxID=1076179 RepID=A0A645F0B4_9ZZZZ